MMSSNTEDVLRFIGGTEKNDFTKIINLDPDEGSFGDFILVLRT